MPLDCVPESLPLESQTSQRYPYDYAFEPTQLSQSRYSQTQGTQLVNSQIEPRRKYWAILVPVNPDHCILKISWARSSLQIGRGPMKVMGNDIQLEEKRVSNRHCRITLGVPDSQSNSSPVQAWKEGEGEPEVWVEDLNSSNGTFVNGERVQLRRVLQHGDELSLGSAKPLDGHDVRYIFRSVGGKGARYGSGLDKVGEVYEKYQLLKELGKGTFATVYRAVDVNTGDMRAIKQILKHRFLDNAKTMMLFKREVAICEELEHENICRLLEHYEDPQHICLVLEYVDGGDLLDYIMKADGPGLPEQQAADLAFQICQAMCYTHGKDITHRDLKPENILLASVPGSSDRRVKIADFGLAKMVDAGTKLTSMVGTPQYLAPEVVMQSSTNPGYANKVDCWSVGIVVYSMMTKALPFEENEELPVDRRIKARFDQDFDQQTLREVGVSAEGIDFIARLLEPLPEHRMSMSEALSHPWLAGSASQPSSSLPGLGGDSTWDVHEVGYGNNVDDDDDDGRGDEDGWTRPGTASGTNMESGLVAPGSDEGFSQPMRGLDLNKRSPGAESVLKRKYAFSSGSLSPAPASGASDGASDGARKRGGMGGSPHHDSPTKRPRRASGARGARQASPARVAETGGERRGHGVDAGTNGATCGRTATQAQVVRRRSTRHRK